MSAHGSALPPAERRAEVARVRRAAATACDRRHVLRRGEHVVVACSGGPDSSALLDALARLAPPRGWVLTAAHVDHGLRPGSDREAGRVAAEAARLGVDFAALTVEVRGRGSPQDLARRARHAALRELAAERGATAVALGHTADDQAETVLMRLLGGGGPAALAAMGPRDGMLARPLLGLWRDDTIAYCAALGIDVLDDPSNADPRHLRARVRHELLPALERVFPGARRRLAVLADRERERNNGAVEGPGAALSAAPRRPPRLYSENANGQSGPRGTPC